MFNEQTPQYSRVFYSRIIALERGGSRQPAIGRKVINNLMVHDFQNVTTEATN